MEGPKAPQDAKQKRKSFYIMRHKEVAGSVQPDGSGTQFIYLNDGRMISSAKIVGSITDATMLKLLETTEGFRRLVHSIGVTVETSDTDSVDFVFQMYGKTDTYGSGTVLRKKLTTDGMEQILTLSECKFSEDDAIPGQIRIEFPKAGEQAIVDVRFYLEDGFDAPEPEEEEPVDFTSKAYKKMLNKSLLQLGNTYRLKRALEKAKRGEEVTVAFIGGSITQGAGAIPINTQCYAFKTFEGLCSLLHRGTKDNLHYIKAGVGGTPSELGMLRYEQDVLRDGTITPDIVIVEFAVNDEGDETKGECYDSLVRKILSAPNEPAVLLLFAVFANDWNLQERLNPVGKVYELPMVSVRDCVVEQFYLTKEQGRVLTKNQFFYDCFHPTNLGHQIMADCILHLIQAVEQSTSSKEDLNLEDVEAPIGGEFQRVQLLDRADTNAAMQISVGDFFHKDEELQAVERDLNLIPTKEFPNNWMHKLGSTPFAMDIVCTALLIVYKDSGSIMTGCAEVWVDGEKKLLIDPRQNGWTHCNAYICMRRQEKKSHHVEVRMQAGDECKEFTILGFGYVN